MNGGGECFTNGSVLRAVEEGSCSSQIVEVLKASELPPPRNLFRCAGHGIR